jgi:hypothetical protein
MENVYVLLGSHHLFEENKFKVLPKSHKKPFLNILSIKSGDASCFSSPADYIQRVCIGTSVTRKSVTYSVYVIKMALKGVKRYIEKISE